MVILLLLVILGNGNDAEITFHGGCDGAQIIGILREEQGLLVDEELGGVAELQIVVTAFDAGLTGKAFHQAGPGDSFVT